MRDRVRTVLQANARWWEAEQALIDTYWTWDGRTLGTDLDWLARQCHKEMYDGVLVRLAALERGVTDLHGHDGVAAVAAAADGVRTEYAHLRAFAAVYERWQPDGHPLDLRTLAASGWAENVELGSARARHRAEHARLGGRAALLTEGGGGALYASGAALTGAGIDAEIAAACASVKADERDHLLEGVAGLHITADETAALVRFSDEQGRLRLRMRWAQFGRPVPEAALHALAAGCDGSSVPIDALLDAAGI